MRPYAVLSLLREASAALPLVQGRHLRCAKADQGGEGGGSLAAVTNATTRPSLCSLCDLLCSLCDLLRRHASPPRAVPPRATTVVARVRSACARRAQSKAQADGAAERDAHHEAWHANGRIQVPFAVDGPAHGQAAACEALGAESSSRCSEEPKAIRGVGACDWCEAVSRKGGGVYSVHGVREHKVSGVRPTLYIYVCTVISVKHL